MIAPQIYLTKGTYFVTIVKNLKVIELLETEDEREAQIFCINYNKKITNENKNIQHRTVREIS